VSSLGAGVNLDASVPAQRITFYDDTHADAQDDGLSNFEYDLHKIWACMGRAGVNGVTRRGLIEEGDPDNGWQAGHIEPNVGGVYAGTDYWNNLATYCPVGSATANDFTVYGALSPFSGLLLHLGAAVAQPTVIAEFWNGAWSALTLTTTPDFSQANGKTCQRVVWLMPTGWVANQLGANAGTYYHMRIRNAAPNGPAAVANTNYKDFLTGHFKYFWSSVSLKRGDDGSGANGTTFRHEGNFGLRFRTTFFFDGSRTNMVQPVTLGKVAASSQRYGFTRPWYLSASRLPASFRAFRMYGGLLCGRTIDDGTPARCDFLGTAGIGDLVDTEVAGYGNVRLGAGGSGAMNQILRSQIAPNPDSTAASTLYTVEGAGITQGKDVIVIKAAGISQDIGFRQDVNASVRIEGLTFTDDDYNVGQIHKVGSGIIDLFDMKWGGPNKKVAAGGILDTTGSNEIREWRRLPIDCHLDGSWTAPPAGIPFRITDAAAVVQATGTFDGSGVGSYGNLYPNAPVVGTQNQNIVLASRWTDPVAGAETLLDEHLKIEVNPSDLSGYNPTYATVTEYYRFPREVLYDPIGATYVIADWQRRDGSITVALPLASSGPPSAQVLVADSVLESEMARLIQAPALVMVD